MKKIKFLLLAFIFILSLFMAVSCSVPTPEPEAKEYTVTFDSAGGSEVAAQTIKDGGKITEPKSPEKEGYTFEGWYVDEEKWSFSYGVVSSDITLTAKWTQKVTDTETKPEPTPDPTPEPTPDPTPEPMPEEKVYYTVKFNTGTSETISDQKVESGYKATKPTVPTKKGYIFEGWYLDGEKWSFVGHIVTGDMTLTAKWSLCEDHADENADGLCDKCNSDAVMFLIFDENVKFRIVKGESLDNATNTAIELLKYRVNTIGGNLTVLEHGDAIVNDGTIEVLVGDVTNRGAEYIVEKHTLGYEGYVIKVVNNKIIIQGGSNEALADAFDIFTEDILDIGARTQELSDASIEIAYIEEYIQDDYDITSISIGGVDIKGHTIAADANDSYFYPVALLLRESLYREAGYWLPIVSLSEAGDKSIILAAREKDATCEDSFRVYADGATLYIECEYVNAARDNTEFFIAKYITVEDGDINFSGRIMKKDVSVVYYEDFGAKGDGKTNDFQAIYMAHKYANEGGQIVLGKTTATYYISSTVIDGRVQTITIKTPTDWQGARFIIDDTNLSQTDSTGEYSKSIFTISSNYATARATTAQISAINNGEKLGPNTKKLDLGLGYKAMLVIYNEHHRNHIRYGVYANDGAYQHELVIVDEDGNIEDGTELLLDYDKVTKIEIYRIDEEPLEIKNATFTTLASRVDTTVDGREYRGYFSRNISVERSNATISNIAHYVEGEFTVEEQAEGFTGPAYRGFFQISDANNVTIRDCVITGRRYYGTPSYGFTATLANDVELKHCEQSNYYKADGVTLSTKTNQVTRKAEYWRIGGSSYCKNLAYDGCVLTCFDAYASLYGGKIIDSLVGSVNFIGGGDFIIEHSTIEDDEFFNLRADYGATWAGTVTIKDSELKNTNDSGIVVDMLWTNHDFGYTCHFPNIILDNVSHSNSREFDLIKTKYSSDRDQDSLESWGDYIHIEGAVRPSYSYQSVNINPLTPPDYIIATNPGGISFRIIYVDFFNNTIIRGFEGFPTYDPREPIPW